tara:strand:- start:408 stop:542 length:135 start_codon:yes stop_codon:yes gene_type:complete
MEFFRYKGIGKENNKLNLIFLIGGKKLVLNAFSLKNLAKIKKLI